MLLRLASWVALVAAVVNGSAHAHIKAKAWGDFLITNFYSPDWQGASAFRLLERSLLQEKVLQKSSNERRNPSLT